MGNAYGKSALSASFSMPGIEKYLEKIEAAGNNITEACVEAVNSAAPIVERAMKEGAERHRKNGDVVNAIETTPAKVEGNNIYATVGIDADKHPEAKHAVYQEYGDGHSPGFPDPFVRPAVDDHKNEIRAAERKALKAKGVPID